MSTDDEVIKRRLLIDGNGNGDDRRLIVLLKTFVKWCNSNDTSENNAILHDRLLAQIALCELAVTKSELAEEMMSEELRNYKKISKSIYSSIDTVKSQIDLYKESLKVAKKIRKNRMEYDVLAKIINKQPDRKETIQQHKQLQEELNELHEERLQLNKKLDTKRKEFSVLMNSIKELDMILAQYSSDDKNEESDVEIICDDDLDEECLEPKALDTIEILAESMIIDS